jgi:hypothetical protein
MEIRTQCGLLSIPKGFRIKGRGGTSPWLKPLRRSTLRGLCNNWQYTSHEDGRCGDHARDLERHFSRAIEVGTPIDRCPPLRSRLVELPHRAPRRTCRLSAADRVGFVGHAWVPMGNHLQLLLRHRSRIWSAWVGGGGVDRGRRDRRGRASGPAAGSIGVGGV